MRKLPVLSPPPVLAIAQANTSGWKIARLAAMKAPYESTGEQEQVHRKKFD